MSDTNFQTIACCSFKEGGGGEQYLMISKLQLVVNRRVVTRYNFNKSKIWQGPSREMFAPLVLFLFMIMSTINYTLQIAFHFVCVYCFIIDPINGLVIFCLTIFYF